MTRRSDGNDDLSLQQAADLLGVHYMTAYRYVRTGRLAATQVDNKWRVRRASLARLTKPRPPGRVHRGQTSSRLHDQRRLSRLLIQGDEIEAWRLTQQLLASSCTPEQLYLDVLGPALRIIGDGWEAGDISVAEEHRASAVTYRLVGRLGPMFTRPGPTRGVVVLGAPTGDFHGLATALVADVLRGRGFSVVDLGGSTPAESFVEAISRSVRVVAVGVVVSAPIDDADITQTVTAIRSATAAPVLLGGRAIRDEDHGRTLGADASTATARDAVDWFDTGPPGRAAD